MSAFTEFQGIDQPSSVMIVSRRWDLQGHPWQLGLRQGDAMKFEDYADFSELVTAIGQTLGIAVTASQDKPQ